MIHKKLQRKKILLHKFYKLNLLAKSLPAKPSILLAISGGQDSIALLFLFYFFKEINQWDLGIVHCNHLWQPKSTHKASELAVLIKQLKLNYYEATASATIRNEEEARLWRYQIITKIAHNHHYNIVLTAHTANDEIETLIGYFLREARLKRISRVLGGGIQKTKIKYLRPFLEFSRLETKIFCENYKVPVHIDLSNTNLKFKRNRIRHELLPYIRLFFNPNLDKTLFEFKEK